MLCNTNINVTCQQILNTQQHTQRKLRNTNINVNCQQILNTQQHTHTEKIT